MNERYDVVVVGGGPGGSWAAKHAADRGLSVLLCEKDRDIGVPVRCAEGLSAKQLEKLVKVDESWIATTIRGARLVAPDSTSVVCFTDEIGYLIDTPLGHAIGQSFDHILHNAVAEVHDSGRDLNIGSTQKDIFQCIDPGFDAADTR